MATAAEGDPESEPEYREEKSVTAAPLHVDFNMVDMTAWVRGWKASAEKAIKLDMVQNSEVTPRNSVFDFEHVISRISVVMETMRLFHDWHVLFCGCDVNKFLGNVLLLSCKLPSPTWCSSCSSEMKAFVLCALIFDANWGAFFGNVGMSEILAWLDAVRRTIDSESVYRWHVLMVDGAPSELHYPETAPVSYTDLKVKLLSSISLQLGCMSSISARLSESAKSAPVNLHGILPPKNVWAVKQMESRIRPYGVGVYIMICGILQALVDEDRIKESTQK